MRVFGTDAQMTRIAHRHFVRFSRDIDHGHVARSRVETIAIMNLNISLRGKLSGLWIEIPEDSEAVKRGIRLIPQEHFQRCVVFDEPAKRAPVFGVAAQY